MEIILEFVNPEHVREDVQHKIAKFVPRWWICHKQTGLGFYCVVYTNESSSRRAKFLAGSTGGRMFL